MRDRLAPRLRSFGRKPATAMLETIAIILVLMWLLGLVSSYTLGGFIHLLLVIAFIAIILRLIRGRNPLG